MRYELRSISVWPFTKVCFLFNLLAGFILGIFYALFAGFLMTLLSNFPMFQMDGFEVESLPIGLLVLLMPFLFALFAAFFHTLFGIVVVVIYNLIAGLAGGLELNFGAVEKQEPRPGYSRPIVAQTAAPYAAPPPPPPRSHTPPPPGSASLRRDDASSSREEGHHRGADTDNPDDSR